MKVIIFWFAVIVALVSSTMALSLSSIALYTELGVIVLLLLIRVPRGSSAKTKYIKEKNEAVEPPVEIDGNFYMTKWTPTGLTWTPAECITSKYYGLVYEEYCLLTVVNFYGIELPIIPKKCYWMVNELELSKCRKRINSSRFFYTSAFHHYTSKNYDISYPGALFRILPSYINWAWLFLSVTVMIKLFEFYNYLANA